MVGFLVVGFVGSFNLGLFFFCGKVVIFYFLSFTWWWFVLRAKKFLMGILFCSVLWVGLFIYELEQNFNASSLLNLKGTISTFI